MRDHQARVEKFMRLAGQDVLSAPTLPTRDVRMLRARLILEEALETVEALGFMPVIDPDGTMMTQVVTIKGIELLEVPDTANLVKIADGCADVFVVTMGTLSACGMDAEPIVRAVDESNLAKFTGDAHRREDGKWVKPSDWKAPDIAGLLDAQGMRDT
jgi:predicted HAD superfamily Cof-like phosphohydrolase